MNTPGSDSNESPRKRSRLPSVGTPVLQLPNDKSHSANRVSEFDVNKAANVSLDRKRMPKGAEEEKHVNKAERDSKNLSLPASSGFDNKLEHRQQDPNKTTAPDTSALGMNKSTAISANLSQPQKINSGVYSQADISATGIS